VDESRNKAWPFFSSESWVCNPTPGNQQKLEALAGLIPFRDAKYGYPSDSQTWLLYKCFFSESPNEMLDCQLPCLITEGYMHLSAFLCIDCEYICVYIYIQLYTYIWMVIMCCEGTRGVATCGWVQRCWWYMRIDPNL
jgi:hypothetical protein